MAGLEDESVAVTVRVPVVLNVKLEMVPTPFTMSRLPPAEITAALSELVIAIVKLVPVHVFQ